MKEPVLLKNIDTIKADIDSLKTEKLDASNHSWNSLLNKPSSLPANGGNADTVDGLHASNFGRYYQANGSVNIADTNLKEFYGTCVTQNSSAPTTDWWHIINVPHSDQNGYGGQLAIGYHGNPHLMVRSASGTSWGQWYDVVGNIENLKSSVVSGKQEIVNAINDTIGYASGLTTSHTHADYAWWIRNKVMKNIDDVKYGAYTIIRSTSDSHNSVSYTIGNLQYVCIHSGYNYGYYIEVLDINSGKTVVESYEVDDSKYPWDLRSKQGYTYAIRKNEFCRLGANYNSICSIPSTEDYLNGTVAVSSTGIGACYYRSKLLCIIKPNGATLSKTLTEIEDPYGTAYIALDNDYVYVTSKAKLYKYRLSDLSLVSKITIASYGAYSDIAVNNKYVYLINNLVRIRVSDFVIVGEVTTGANRISIKGNDTIMLFSANEDSAGNDYVNLTVFDTECNIRIPATRLWSYYNKTVWLKCICDIPNSSMLTLNIPSGINYTISGIGQITT